MYVVLENGSKQYKAEIGQVVMVEKLNANVGDKVQLNVIMVSDENGVDLAPKKAVVEVVEQGKFKKVVVYKYKAKKNERKKQGHRQPFTAVKLLEVVSE